MSGIVVNRWVCACGVDYDRETQQCALCRTVQPPMLVACSECQHREVLEPGQRFFCPKCCDVRAGMSEGREYSPLSGGWWPPPEELVNDACMSYRHDFGMMHPEDAEILRADAVEWLTAWRKAGQFRSVPSLLDLARQGRAPLRDKGEQRPTRGDLVSGLRGMLLDWERRYHRAAGPRVVRSARDHADKWVDRIHEGCEPGPNPETPAQWPDQGGRDE